MNIRLLITSFVILLLALHTPSASALTMKQVFDICHSSSSECSNHPMIQSYIGQAFDLLATLNEQMDYLGKMCCKKTKELFDVPAIIRFMELRSEQYATDNAMLVLVRYFEEHGGCKP